MLYECEQVQLCTANLDVQICVKSKIPASLSTGPLCVCISGSDMKKIVWFCVCVFAHLSLAPLKC